MSSVAVLGAAGGIGQPLSLLLKQSPLVTTLNLYDVVNTPGVAADLSHCSTPAKVNAFVGKDQAVEALKGAEVVVIPVKSYLKTFLIYIYRRAYLVNLA